MKRNAFRRTVLFLLLLALIIPQSAASQSTAGKVYSVSGMKDLKDWSVSALQEAWEVIQVPDRRFDEAPSAVYPYRLGKLNGGFLRQNLDLLNFFRLAARLPAVQDTDADNTDAQYGAVLLAASNTLDHEPPKPARMTSEFYRRGCQAVSAGNISVVQFWGEDEESIEQSKLHAAVPMLFRNYMNGFGSYNRSCVPHRRWILYPDLQSVGIGCADASDSSMYQVLKVVGAQGTGAAAADYDFIAWPASGSFPVQAMTADVPWSITLNPARFQTPDRDRLRITVTRLSDNQTWTFDASSSTDSQSDRFLLVDTQHYGVDNCILFAFPSGQTEAYSGDYRISVTGLTTRDNHPAVLDYQVHFIDLASCSHDWSDWATDIVPTCQESGLAHRLCALCGELEQRVLPPLEHDWAVGTTIRESEKYRNGLAVYHCSRCGEQKIDVLPLKTCRDADCPCNAFADAPAKGNWAHNGVDFVVENGIFNGTSANTFSPKGKMTRAMMVTVLWRMAGRPASGKAYTFTDVDGSAYYAPAVRWASENGVVRGYSAQRFGPSDNITREQAVTLLQRFFVPDAQSAGAMDGFRDAQQVQPYARASMCWAIENHVITGQADADGELYLLPGDSISREQAASVIMRCMMNLN